MKATDTAPQMPPLWTTASTAWTNVVILALHLSYHIPPIESYPHHRTSSAMSTNQPPTDEGNVPITNTLFPPPPSYFKAFTETNLARFAELRDTTSGPSRLRDSAPDDEAMSSQSRSDGADRVELERLRGELEKPNVDWVNEDGRWMCFGQMYSVCLVRFPFNHKPCSSLLTRDDCLRPRGRPNRSFPPQNPSAFNPSSTPTNPLRPPSPLYSTPSSILSSSSSTLSPTPRESPGNSRRRGGHTRETNISNI